MSPPLLSPKLNPANNVFEKLDFNKVGQLNIGHQANRLVNLLDPTSSTTCLIPFTDIISQM